MSQPAYSREPFAKERIDGECPRCRLPIYASDPRRISYAPWDECPRLYHAGCANALEALFYESSMADAAQRLRGLGYVVELTITRPMR